MSQSSYESLAKVNVTQVFRPISIRLPSYRLRIDRRPWLPLSFELVQYNLDISMVGMFSYFDNISLYLPTETHICVSLCSFCVGEKRIESRSCENILKFFQKFQGRRLVRSRMIIFKVHFFYSFELQLLDVNEIRKMLATYC